MPDETLTLTTHSEEETESVAAAIMELLPEGAVVALRGELGAGKTCFVRGMASDAPVSSPTFTMVNEYAGPPAIYHLDLYRIEHLSEVLDLGYEDLFDAPPGICVIEWAERAESFLPRTRLDITLEHVSPDERRISITNLRLLPEDWQVSLAGLRKG